MEKAERIRKIVTRVSAGVIFACLLVVTLQINFQGNNGNSPLSLGALTFGLFQPAMAAGGGGTCTAPAGADPCPYCYGDCTENPNSSCGIVKKEGTQYDYYGCGKASPVE